ncbi:MAG TPA: hypothetical protein VFA43_19570 [Gemmatimonadaceae bacterium]|nr:hypothetical protein [Gemmatimonadaceae bacterium]
MQGLANQYQRRYADACLTAAALMCVVGCGGSGGNMGPPPQAANTGVTLNFGGTASPGDTVSFSIAFASGDVPGHPVYLRLSLNGGPPSTDTAQVPSAGEEVEGSLFLSPQIPLGTLTLTVVLPVEKDSAVGRLTIVTRPPPPPVPNPAPALSVAFVQPATPAAFTQGSDNQLYLFSGLTDSLSVHATDAAGLSWIGWQFGSDVNTRDSVAATGTAATAEFAVMPPPSLIGNATTLAAFARSTDGTLHDTTLSVAGVGQYTDHPVMSALLNGAFHDLVYDPKRNFLYVSQGTQAAVAVISVATMSYAGSIALPAPPWGIDLVPSSDSLVAALANTADLAFVDLTNPAYPVTTSYLSALDGAAADTAQPFNTVLYPRVAADRRILLLLGGNGGGLGSFDLTTQTSGVYTAGSYGTVPERSGDGSLVMMPDVGGCWWSAYYAAVHTFALDPSTCGSVASPIYNGLQVSATQTGAYFTIGHTLYAASPGSPSGLSPVGQALIPDEPYDYSTLYGSAIASNAGAFYLAAPSICGGVSCANTAPGFYFKFTLTYPMSGTTILTPSMAELVDAPETPLRLVALPGAQSLLAVGPTKLMLFDLTRSTVPPSALHVSHRSQRAVARTQPRPLVELHWRVR